ncbi:MAG: Lacal_2735 family protein [Gammaproteobacteria bacterium]|nr:Lacal_2735 family protein [Gammaproteobacteria bacterium]
MFSRFRKSKRDKLKREYTSLLEQAMQAQRRGDIRSYSDLSDQAKSVLDEIDSLQK